MRSNPSSSPDSAKRFTIPDPPALLMPLLLGLLRAAPWAAFFSMFLGPEFGMSQGREAPWVWALALISALGFWSVRFLPRVIKNETVFNLLLVGIGIAAWVVWMSFSPGWQLTSLEGSGLGMVGKNGRLIWMFIIAMVFWFLTLRLALDEREQSADAVRGILTRSLVAIVVSIALAASIGGAQGEAGLRQAFIALPVALVSGVGAVGMSEMASTRALARKRGTTVPGWDRWLRVFIGTSIVLLAITLVAAIVFGPGFVSFVLDALRTVWQGVATVLLWILYGIVYAMVYIAQAVAWLLNRFFDLSLEVPEPPPMAPAGTPEPILDQPAETTDGGPWLDLAKLGLIGIVLLIGTALLFRFARFRARGSDADADEERTSVFSGKLIRDQLRNLFRRRGDHQRPRKLDLAQDPTSVREAMLYMQTLAARLDIPRELSHTPQDFSRRLQAAWPNVRSEVTAITALYENVRYGETERDRRDAVSAWRGIWQDRKDMPNAAG